MTSILPIFDHAGAPGALSLAARQILDQDHVNCCFSCALVTAMEAHDVHTPALAPLFHFFFAGGPNTVDDGLTPLQARIGLLQHGICARDRHPFPISRENVDREPSQDAIDDGMRRRPWDPATGDLLWAPVSTVDPERSWKRYLTAGFPVVAGMQPNQNYLSLNAANPALKNNDPPYGDGHVTTAIGFSDSLAAFIMQDSRGTAFGKHGQWFLPYALCASPFIVLAFALARDI